MNMDMNQFLQVFIEESTELLEDIEQTLVNLNDGIADNEEINSIFRCAHSIKGGSATFGLKQISEFTHVVETYLDKVRDGHAQMNADIVSLLLDFVDVTGEMLTAAADNSEYDEARAEEIKTAFQALVDAVEQGGGGATQADVANVSTTEADDDEDDLQALFDALKNGGDEDDDGLTRGWRIFFKPASDMIRHGNEPLRIIRELSKIGDLSTTLNTHAVPDLNELIIDECYLEWTFELYTNASEQQINEEIFSWVLIDSDIQYEAITRESVPVEIPEHTQSVSSSETPPVSEITTQANDMATATATKTKASDNNKKVEAPSKKAANKNNDMASIRVATDKVDALIDIVGELIITQSMLTQIAERMNGNENAELKRGITQLKLNSRELQESVMRIRMLPIGFIFNRFPRLIRDISRKLGKAIKFEVTGESTELDKGILEKLSDPMVHLIRNGLDHGIESKEKRIEVGKPEEGTLSIHAYHQGGNVIIDIIDDGAGLNKGRILSKAIENGLIDPEATYTDREINHMIFMPGFSTADEVTDISGRGVGMDVVRRNIQELGGVIEVESTEGEGSKFTIRLPLTLSILDGQLTSLNNDIYILPLTNIIESIQISPDQINRITEESAVYSLRNEFIPLIGVKEIFGFGQEEQAEKQFVVIVEAKDKKYGLLVDELSSQQQVVLKNIDSHYRQIEGISGATILGDGKIALIIDVEGIVSLYEKSKTGFVESHASSLM